MRRIKLSQAKGKRYQFPMMGGPLNGKSVYLSSMGTLPISMMGQRGHYDSSNQWVPA